MESTTQAAPPVRRYRVLVDLSAFAAERPTGELRYIVKELTVVDIDSGCHQHWVFKSPEDTSCCGTAGINWRLDWHNDWLSNHYIGLDYRTGLAEYDSLNDALDYHCRGARLVFAPNRVKAQILDELLNSDSAVIDLEALGCPPPPNFNFFSRSVAAYDGVSLSDFHDPDDRPSIYHIDLDKDIFNFPPSCLYHQISGGFVCTQSRALHMAAWCARNPAAIDMNDSACRHKTFDKWTLSVPSARDMADAGYVVIGTTENGTKCVYCGFAYGRWRDGDDPDTVHANNYPACKHLVYREEARCTTTAPTVRTPPPPPSPPLPYRP